MKKKVSYILLLIACIFTIIFVSSRHKVNKILNINCKLNDVQFYKYQATNDFYCPRAIYIRFSAEPSTLDSLITKYSLRKISVNDWNMYSSFTFKGEIENSIKWWRPKENNIRIYNGQIYYDKSWNRLTIQVDDNNIFYLIIECL